MKCFFLDMWLLIVGRQSYKARSYKLIGLAYSVDVVNRDFKKSGIVAFGCLQLAALFKTVV